MGRVLSLLERTVELQKEQIVMTWDIVGWVALPNTHQNLSAVGGGVQRYDWHISQPAPPPTPINVRIPPFPQRLFRVPPPFSLSLPCPQYLIFSSLFPSHFFVLSPSPFHILPRYDRLLDPFVGLFLAFPNLKVKPTKFEKKDKHPNTSHYCHQCFFIFILPFLTRSRYEKKREGESAWRWNVRLSLHFHFLVNK